MIRSYIYTSLRHLLKNRLYTLINVFGLTLGITCALLIFLITRFELSFDCYHRDTERIYRVVEKENEYGNIKFNQGMPYVLPRHLAKDFDEIEYSALTDGMGEATVKIFTGGKSKLFKEPKSAFVNPDFLRIFHLDWIAGTPEEALKNENSVVISRSTARKYFNALNPVGQTFQLTSLGIIYDLTVTGLIEDVSANSDFPFDILIHYNGEGENKRGWESWGSTSGMVHCYIKLNPGVVGKDFEQKITRYLTTYRDDHEVEHIELKLQPLKDLHYDKRFSNYGGKVISKSSILSLTLIGFFLLITACINFINLNTVLVTKRASEVGIRKILGVKRIYLLWHLLGETAFITLLSIIAALGLSELLIFKVNQVFGYQLTFSLLSDPHLWIFLSVIFVMVSLLAGLYPAFMLSRFKPINALKNHYSNMSYGKGIGLRRGLVVLQLVISQLLVICVLVVYAQMKYFRHAPMGFEKAAVLEFRIPETDKIPQLSRQLETLPEIANFCYSNTGTAFNDVWGGDFTYRNKEEVIKRHAQVKFVDTSFIATYGIDLLAGKNIGEADSVNSFLVNESFVKAMGIQDIEDAIGEEVTIWSRKAAISGVLEDFNTESFHTGIKPVIMGYDAEDFNLSALKLIGSEHSHTIAKVEEIWKSIFPDYVFEYGYLDDKLDNHYKQEKRIANLFQIATMVAIIIGCIGLFGLVSFLASQRAKEMGIRKVLGASSAQILLIFVREFILLISIAFLVALPISWYYMEQWLQNFAYRISLTPWIFCIGVAITLIITLATVGYKSLLIAITNPVNSLRNE